MMKIEVGKEYTLKNGRYIDLGGEHYIAEWYDTGDPATYEVSKIDQKGIVSFQIIEDYYYAPKRHGSMDRELFEFMFEEVEND